MPYENECFNPRNKTKQKIEKKNNNKSRSFRHARKLCLRTDA